jgi:aspartate aminotransferase
MLGQLKAIPPDPILGIVSSFAQDSNPLKIDLGIGVYRDEHGHTPMLRSVIEAEKLMVARQNTKSYLGPAGVPGFNSAMAKMIFGEASEILAQERTCTVQTPGAGWAP